MKKLLTLLLCIVLLLACLPVSAFAATIITRVDLIIDLPVADRTPPNNCTILGNGYTIHSIDWDEISGRGFLESGEKFKEGYTYEATVWVKAADGYEFSNADKNTPAITGYINGESVHVTKAYEYNAWAMVCLTVKFHDIPAKGWIKNVNLSVPAPAAGEKPSYTKLTGLGYETASVSFSGSTPQNMENGIAWYPVGGDRLKPGQDTFGENTAYTFHCLLFPAEGYKISEKAAVWVNGKEAEATLDYDTFLSVEYTFPATGKIPPTHTHSYMDWAWNSGQHYKNCTGCDEIFFAEAHKGGVATCEKDGVCSVCGYAYIKASEEYHIPDTSKWVARGDQYHYHPCKLCGAHCDTEDHRWSPTYLYQDATGHAWICADCKATSAIEKHNPGPAATNTTPQTCKDCGYIIVPAKNHTHELTKVPQTPATCLEEGNIEYYACSGCNNRFTDAEAKNQIPDTMSVAVGALGHTPSDVWGIDDDYHWRVCTTCNQVLDETKMQHDVTDGKCTTCNYVIGDRVTNPETTPAETTPEPGHNAEQSNNTWIKILLVALVCFAAAITATVIILKKKKGE